MGKTIDGKKIAEKINKRVADEMELLGGEAPGLAIVLAGEREDSKLYVDLKQKEARKLGIETHLYKCGEDADQNEVIEIVRHLNQDEEIDAILVQLPLPKKFDTDKIISAIDSSKDVDRFHPENLKILQSTCSHDHVMPPVLGVVLQMLEEIDFETEGRKGCVVANSAVFGKSLCKVLECKGMVMEVCSPDGGDLSEKTKSADVLVSAVGRPGLVKKEMVKEGAVVIDVGITKKNKKVLGDVDFEQVKKFASHITPVPGGVGPATVSMLLLNTVRLAERRTSKSL